MAKEFKMTCDRCSKPMPQGDAMVLDFLSQQYPGDICPDCDIILYLAAIATQRDLINNEPPGTSLKLMKKSFF